MTDRERRAAASPSAWWLWAVVLAAALGALPLPARLVCLAAVVVVTHRSLTTESERVTYGFTLRLAASLVVFRVVIQLLLGADLSTNVLFTLPRLALPLGLHIGGAISLGQMTMYLLVFKQGQQSFAQSLTTIGGMYEDNLYLSNLYELLDEPPEPLTGTATSGMMDARQVCRKMMTTSTTSATASNSVCTTFSMEVCTKRVGS